MNVIRQLLGHELTSDLFAAKFAQFASYAGAIGFLVLAVMKMSKLPLTEVQFFFGLLLILTVTLLMICGGTLARIDAEVRKRNDSGSY